MLREGRVRGSRCDGASIFSHTGFSDKKSEIWGAAKRGEGDWGKPLRTNKEKILGSISPMKRIGGGGTLRLSGEKPPFSFLRGIKGEEKKRGGSVRGRGERVKRKKTRLR